MLKKYTNSETLQVSKAICKYAFLKHTEHYSTKKYDGLSWQSRILVHLISPDVRNVIMVPRV